MKISGFLRCAMILANSEKANRNTIENAIGTFTAGNYADRVEVNWWIPSERLTLSHS
jgi:hypothetical protein